MLRLVRSVVWKVTKFAAIVAATALVTLLAARAYSALQGPQLRPWHTFVPMEMDVETLRPRIGRTISKPRTKYSSQSSKK